MQRRTAVRFATMAAVAASTLGTTGGAAPSPAGAQAETIYDTVAGNFWGGPREEAFSYASGPEADYLISFYNDGYAGGPLSFQSYDYVVNGRYTPVAGDFDGDNLDEILWYAPGPAADYLWNFTGYGTYTTRPYTVNGVYEPVVGDYTGDNTDDILWYAPGAQLDPMWDHVPGSTGYTQQVYDVRGTYRPFTVDLYADGPGGEDIFWYAPGAGGDSVWDFHGGQRRSFPDPQPGYYVPAAGDFFVDGPEEILWDNDAESVLWDHHPGSTSPERTGWVWAKTRPGVPDQSETAPGPAVPLGALPAR